MLTAGLYCELWLRDTSYDYCGYNDASTVFETGEIQRQRNVTLHVIGVVPAMWVSDSSAEWSFTTDGTSGYGGEDRMLQNISASKTTTIPINVNKLTITGISEKLAAGKKVSLESQVLPSKESYKAVMWKTSNKNMSQ